MTKLQTKAEERLIQDYFDDLMKACDRKVSDEGKIRIQKAFEFANSAHAGVKRKSENLTLFIPSLLQK